MVAVSDFSGLISSACALASAAASAATDSLDRGMTSLRTASGRRPDFERHGARFRALAPYAMTEGLVSVFWHERLELRLGAFVVEKSRARIAEKRGELGP